ncbi:MAG: TlpA disulfide reductase family protein [Planctomycetota bacterium]
MPGCGRGQQSKLVDLLELQAELRSPSARVTVVNFWATWCAPCVAELPELLAAVAGFGDASVRLVLVSQDLLAPGAGMTAENAPRSIDQFLSARGLTCRSLVYSGSVIELDQQWDLPGPIPATIVLDAAGRVLARHEGPASGDQFRSMIGRALDATRP